jgi:hypothetical protein
MAAHTALTLVLLTGLLHRLLRTNLLSSQHSENNLDKKGTRSCEVKYRTKIGRGNEREKETMV